MIEVQEAIIGLLPAILLGASTVAGIASQAASGAARQKSAKKQARIQARSARKRASNIEKQLGEFERRADKRLGQYLTEQYDLEADAITSLAASGIDVSQGSSLLLRERAKMSALEKHSNLVEDILWRRKQAASQIRAERQLAEDAIESGEAISQAEGIRTGTRIVGDLLNFGANLYQSPGVRGSSAKG